MMTILAEMTKVVLATPGSGASDDEVAAWYELKAHLLEHIAAEGGPDTEEASRQAVLARRRSARLRRADGPRDAVLRSITSVGQRRVARGPLPHGHTEAA
jgi:hypothetical protein